MRKKKSKPRGRQPKCHDCGQPLRAYRWRDAEWHRTDHNRSDWGDYADGLFCGLRCGYRWAVRHMGGVPGIGPNRRK